MARYLVTGGAGFIGSHLVDDLLADGHAVTALDDLSTGGRANLDPRATFVQGDVADSGLVREVMGTVDGCFHLAAIASVARSTEDWLGGHRVNLTGAITVFDAARAVGGLPVVYASSAAVYGDAPQGLIAETSSPAPLTAYGADKLGAELHGRVAWSAHLAPTTGLRFFNIYGPRQDPRSPYSGVISIFADRLARRLPITIHGGGRQVRDFVHVADAVAHLRAAMASGGAGARVFNVCTGQARSVLDLAAILAEALGVTPEIEHAAARQGDIRHSVGDPTAARAGLGLAAEIGLADGLGRLIHG